MSDEGGSARRRFRWVLASLRGSWHASTPEPCHISSPKLGSLAPFLVLQYVATGGCNHLQAHKTRAPACGRQKLQDAAATNLLHEPAPVTAPRATPAQWPDRSAAKRADWLRLPLRSLRGCQGHAPQTRFHSAPFLTSLRCVPAGLLRLPPGSATSGPHVFAQVAPLHSTPYFRCVPFRLPSLRRGSLRRPLTGLAPHPSASSAPAYARRPSKIAAARPRLRAAEAPGRCGDEPGRGLATTARQTPTSQLRATCLSIPSQNAPPADGQTAAAGPHLRVAEVPDAAAGPRLRAAREAGHLGVARTPAAYGQGRLPPPSNHPFPHHPFDILSTRRTPLPPLAPFQVVLSPAPRWLCARSTYRRPLFRLRAPVGGKYASPSRTARQRSTPNRLACCLPAAQPGHYAGSTYEDLPTAPSTLCASSTLTARQTRPVWEARPPPREITLKYVSHGPAPA